MLAVKAARLPSVIRLPDENENHKMGSRLFCCHRLCTLKTCAVNKRQKLNRTSIPLTAHDRRTKYRPRRIKCMAQIMSFGFSVAGGSGSDFPNNFKPLDLSMNPSEPRVAIVTGGLLLGGTTMFLCNFGGELVRRKIPVQILSFEHANPMALAFERLQIPVLCLDERRQIFEDRMQTVLNHLREFKPTIVLANLSEISFEVLRYLPAGVFRMGAIQSDDPGVYASIASYAGVLDALAGVSAAIKRRVEANASFAGVPVKYLPYGVSMPEKLPASCGNMASALRILYLGRVIQEQKRVRLFPEILKRLAASGIPFHWTVAGDGPDRRFLEANLRTVRPDQSVSILGAAKYEEVPALLAAHDVFLLASDYEGLPLSLLEAMGHGLVPVVSNLPSGIPEVVDENTGILVAPDNTVGYAEAIIALHNNRAELIRLSRNARERVCREFSIASMTDRWLNVFPAQAKPDLTWPQHWRIKPPLAVRNPFRFSPPVRMLRRWVKKFPR
jgi:glycosyltransferase involved in cell wall biosynthesis